jgi:hypothetical protein
MVHVHRALGAGCAGAGRLGAAAVMRSTAMKKGGMIVRLCVLVAALPLTLHAQARELERYAAGSPEAKLMLFYSSTVAFSPIGVPFGVEHSSAMAVASRRSPSRFELSVEVSYLPPLSAEQRTAGSDKPESTNLAPVFARPRLGARLPGGFGLEMSWIPPVRVFDVKANLFAGAISRSYGLPARVRLVPRVSVLGGRVEGPITCNRETADDGNAALATYFSFVCHGNDSRDYFEPRHVAGELIVARASRTGRWQPYITAGARAERTRFDVGVIRQDGSRDLDEPVLEVKTTRAYGAAGASWFGIPRARLAAELYYAPGSAFTARGLAGVRLW